MSDSSPRLVIIPDYLSAEIDARLDAAISENPDAEKDRAFLRSQLIDAVDRCGFIPDFAIAKAGG